MIDAVTHAVRLVDADTGDEITGINFPMITVVPRVGEMIHWYQDGTADDACADSGLRRWFRVESVTHDWRYMPPRHGGRSLYVQYVVLYVTETERMAPRGRG